MTVRVPTEEWFCGELARAHDALFSRFEEIKKASAIRVSLDRFYSSLYHSESYQGYGANSDFFSTLATGIREILNENVVQRIVSILCAKLARNRAVPSILTTDADWGLKQRAKTRELALQAVFRSARVYERQRQSDLNMVTCGTGALFCGHRKGTVVVDWVPSWEIFVDPSEARYGEPRTLYREQVVDRRQWATLYPAHREAIMNAKPASASDAGFTTGRESSDMIQLVSAWRLPSFEGADDGAFAMCVSDATIAHGPWRRNRFPVAISRYLLAPRGFYGVGAINSLVGLQLELNRTHATTQEAMSLIKPYVLVEAGSKVVRTDFSDEVGNFIEYTGTPPQIVTPNAVHPETLQHTDRLKTAMYASSGIPESAAMAMKPAGLNSGKAIRTYADMSDEAIHDVLQRREQQIVDLGELILDALEDIDELDDEMAPLVYVGPFSTKRVEYSDFADDRDATVLQVQPASELSTLLAGKFEDLEDMRNLGIISDPDDMIDMLQIPDLQALKRRKNSLYDLIRKAIEENVLRDGVAITPDPSWDLERCLALSREARFAAQLAGAPEDRLDLLRIFEEKCIFFLEKAGANAAAMAPPEQPQAVEQPLPSHYEDMPNDDDSTAPIGDEMSPEAGGFPVQ
jgi:hypothetical protein